MSFTTKDVQQVGNGLHDTSVSARVGPRLLWVNLMVDSVSSGLSKQFGEVFDLTFNRPSSCAIREQVKPPSFICFEYDYPDCQSLKVLKDTHEQYPDTPIIMFTLQHSEDLAVWALRNRVWDYYVKPMSKENFDSLSREMLIFYRQQSETDYVNRRKSTSINSSYPNDVRFKRVNSETVIVDIAINFLESNFSRKVTEKEVSDLCEMSRFQFSRLFKRTTAITFQNYLLNLRICKAKQLLLNPSAKVVDVAYTVGFSDASYFTRAFRRATGHSPSDFRNR